MAILDGRSGGETKRKVKVAVKSPGVDAQPSKPRGKSGAGASRIAIESILHPGKSRSVDAARYGAMREALLKVLPSRSPGTTLAEASSAVRAHLPEDLFPGGATAGWWMKAVQLDLEAKGTIVREDTRPLRIRRS
jgi:hypothetical protein